MRRTRCVSPTSFQQSGTVFLHLAVKLTVNQSSVQVYCWNMSFGDSGYPNAIAGIPIRCKTWSAQICKIHGVASIFNAQISPKRTALRNAIFRELTTGEAERLRQSSMTLLQLLHMPSNARICICSFATGDPQHREGQTENAPVVPIFQDR